MADPDKAVSAQPPAGGEDPAEGDRGVIERDLARNRPDRTAGGGGNPETHPGDVAPAGTPGTGENFCPDCAGTGRRNGAGCKTCDGTGKVIQGIGGA